MAKVKVHELAKELGKENREIMSALQRCGADVKSHMSNVEETEAVKVRAMFSHGAAKEDECMEQKPEKPTEQDVVRRTEDERPPQPKKKNIIQVFRPQNSKTGMVKPGSRPRPQGQGGTRPRNERAQGGTRVPGARPQGQAAGARPQGSAAQGQAAGARPQGSAAQGQTAGARPQGSAVQGQAAGARPQGSAAQGQAAGARPQSGAVQGQAAGARPQSSAAQGQAAGARPQSSAAQGQAASVRPQSAGSESQMTNAKQQPAPAQSQETSGVRPAAPQGQGAGVKAQTSPAQESSAKPQEEAAPRKAQAPQGQTSGEKPQQTGANKNPVKRQDVRPSADKARTGAPAKQAEPSRRQGDSRGQEAKSQETKQPESKGQSSRPQGDGQNRNQGSRSQGDGQGRGQGGNRSQGGGRYQNDGQGRSQGGGQGRNQGGRGVGIPKAPAESKPLEKESRKRTERGDRNRNDKGEKLERMEKNVRQNTKNGRKNQSPKAVAPQPVQKPEETIRTITIPEKLTVGELAEAMKIQASALIKKLFLQGTMVTVNQELEYDKAEEIALEFNCICEKEVKVDVLEELLKEEEEPEETMVPRSPVVCVMGHVDHGKTSLLDAIRNTHVIDREAGGITQHIGASVVGINGQKITFLDTPGHEAFTAMRMRGANSTDIAILVVAADDGVMPQTIEAINHAKAAGIEIIVAINKIDKPGANIDKVKQELTEYELVAEDWGGNTIMVPVSAHTHEGLDSLLENVLLVAEVSELKANPKRKARGLVIEAKLDKGKGPVATVLVQKGTLRVGEPIAAGACYGKVRAMMDDKGRRVKEAGPSTPVEILGLSDVPNAGEVFIAMDNEKDARSFAETFISEGRERMLEETRQRMSLDDLFSQIQAGSLKELNLIVKADVQGSVEAVKQSLLKLSNEEVVVKVIHGGVGAINESDVILASASNAIIIGFNVRPDVMAKTTAEREGVDVRLYRVIYDAIADVEAAMKGMLDPVFEEKVIGHAEIRQTFKASGVGTIAGSYVLDGIFQRGCSARITREGKEIFNGAVASLKRFKDDVKEVRAGYECGIVFEKFNDVREEDIIEAYVMVEVPR